MMGQEKGSAEWTRAQWPGPKKHETSSDGKKGQNIGRNACTQRIGMEGTETGWTEVQAARTRRKRSDQGGREGRVERKSSPD